MCTDGEQCFWLLSLGYLSEVYISDPWRISQAVSHHHTRIRPVKGIKNPLPLLPLFSQEQVSHSTLCKQRCVAGDLAVWRQALPLGTSVYHSHCTWGNAQGPLGQLSFSQHSSVSPGPQRHELFIDLNSSQGRVQHRGEGAEQLVR